LELLLPRWEAVSVRNSAEVLAVKVLPGIETETRNPEGGFLSSKGSFSGAG
jgi:hypothetical protein